MYIAHSGIYKNDNVFATKTDQSIINMLIRSYGNEIQKIKFQRTRENQKRDSENLIISCEYPAG